jgi:hypothetical protein
VTNLWRLFDGLQAVVRKIGQDPDVREDGTHTNVNETIDRSVFERWRTVPAYRPPNLTEWATRKKVDPAKLSSSVRADARSDAGSWHF